ncbi:hypothetical protein QTP70_022589, partial [Hemibagrus guttatus]
VHSFIVCTAYLIYSRVTGSLSLSQASSGIKAGYTLDGVPTHRRAHTHTLSYYGQFKDANQPTMHVFGPGREPPRHRENMQTPHTRQRSDFIPEPH